MATAKLPVWQTTRECLAFVRAHPGDLVRIGWLPLALLFALSLGFGTYEPVAVDRSNPLANLQVSKSVIAMMLQGAIATVMLVAWHRLVMKDYVAAESETADSSRASVRRVSVYFIQLLLLSIVFVVVFAAAVLGGAAILLGIHYFIFDNAAPAGVSDDTMNVILGYVAVLFALPPAFYVVFRLVLALPATALDRRGQFEQAWEISAGNGWRMVAVTMIAIVPIEIVNFVLTLAARATAGSLLFYPVVLLASISVLMLMVALGTTLSKFYAAITQPMRQTEIGRAHV